MEIPYVNVLDFRPNPGPLSTVPWTPVGPISSVTRTGNTFTLALATGGRRLQISFLSSTCFRVRFDPNPAVDYTIEGSPAVVTRNLGAVALTIVENSSARLILDTGSMRVHVDLQPYRVRVFRGGQLISADEPSYNLVFAPNQIAIANFKTRPINARYCGFGEKAGAQLLKNLFTMTQFNYNNFSYSELGTAPSGNNPLNPSIALYASIPFMIETNPAPVGDFAGPPYSYGLFFDNGSQSYHNIGSNDYSVMDGKFYFGALFNQIDYYFFLGNAVVDVLSQYTTLTGRSPMPPKYAFGYHQGCYGYFSRAILEDIANQYRASGIPCDGLHIDIDFQNNYRNFTHSDAKFPNAAQMLTSLRNQGFKCSTNVTALMTDNPLDENNNMTIYAQRQNVDQAFGLIFNVFAGKPPNPTLFQGSVNYGDNPPQGSFRHNPFPYPPLKPNQNGVTPLGAFGNYPDLGRANVRQLWGQQYAHLINDLGMDMIWQDMQCPALDNRVFENSTLPLDLMVNDNVTFVPHGVCHNFYAMFMLMATSDALAQLRPQQRNFIIARGGYAGMQRFAALWTGDSASSWDFLRINVPEVLNIGLSGVPISGCDIGGFATGSGSEGDGITNPALFTRWMHLGSFLPWYRNHYFGYQKRFQEPFNYPQPVPTNCRKYVELRYRMLQIYYDAMFEWTQTGMPIARALFLNDPNDLAVYDHLDDEFFVGKDFLVAPILSQSNLRDIYLPAGSDWYAFKDNQVPLESPVPGGTTVTNFFAGLDLVPIYVRAGAILPMRSRVEQYVDELPANPLDITIYPGPDDTYLLYQDDGLTSKAATQGQFRTTEISHLAVAGGARVRLRRLVDNYQPSETFYTIRLLETAQPSSVTVAGTPVPNVGSAGALDAAAINAFFFDGGLRSTLIKVFDTAADVTVEALI